MLRLREPPHCCIVCGRDFLSLGAPSSALEEREEWMNLKKGSRDDRSYMVKAEHIESMYFHKRPWIWTGLYRAIVRRPHIDYIGISGITQSTLMPLMNDPFRLPRDPRKACIGWPRVNPEASSCTPYWTADILNPENNKRAPVEQIGYLVHAHCWILVDRIIGFGLVEANLKIAPWKKVGYETEENTSPDPDEWEPTSLLEDDPRFLPAWENPTIVPRIQEIIEQATRGADADSRSRWRLSSVVSRVPLDIGIQIVEFTKLATITDTRNMLTAFGWRLPDSYWKSRCKMDLIFEYGDLQKTNRAVDWQFIGLATEELMEDPKWDRNTGFGTRLWIFQYLEQIQTIFLDIFERDKTQPGFLNEPARRRYPLRKGLL